MAVGLPGGMGIPGISNSPAFITGEPRREYLFKFLLVSALSPSEKKKPSWVISLLSNVFLTYVSSLAEQVNLPPSKLTIGNVALSTLQYPYVKGFETPNFSVVYLEDELGSVFRFHKMWQDNIRGSSEDVDSLTGGDKVSGGSGLQFEPLGNVCCTAVYSPTKPLPLPIPLPVDLPLGADVFPYVFPSEIQRSPANKSGANLAKVTVTYTRVPDISEWNYSKRGSKAVSLKDVD